MSSRPRGVTLVELIVFIIIVGVAMAGLFAAFDTITKASADPQVRKQVLAIAESLMEEVQLMPFTYCDPDDPAAATATIATDCATAETAATNVGDATTFEPGESRYNATTPFDNVNDYHRFQMPLPTGIQDITNANIDGLGAYSADIRVIKAGIPFGLALDDDAVRIIVTVTGPGGVSTTIEGYRMRYAPNTLP